MTHHPIFNAFSGVPSTGSGQHVFDFIGTRTRASFRKGWDVHALAAGRTTVPPLPPPNEHYFDWVATLQAVDKARESFRMVELGAGWAPWLVRAALACRQRPGLRHIELLAVEADSTHHRWVLDHFADNGLLAPQAQAIYGAMAARPGVIRFPRVTNPDENYGASTRSATASSDHVEVPAFTLADVLGRLSGPVDFLHVDIQGAEYDVVPAALGLLQEHVRSMMIGTHLSDDLHSGLAQSLRNAGFEEVMNFPRNRLSDTSAGEIMFGDGFLYFRNPALDPR